jgi:signal transduction histidine kinase/DNA-binding response OmpR family regulator
MPMPSETLIILLVEDDTRDARLVQEKLQENEAFQFHLIHVSTLEDAVTCLSATPSISVVLLDLSLPNARGVSMVTRLLQVSPDVPVVVMSSRFDAGISDATVPSEALQALENGARDYLIKDEIDSKLLVRSIHYAIARQKATFRQYQQAQQLKAEAQKFRTLYESISAAVILLDENGIFDANSAALQLFGCTRREQFCGKAVKPNVKHQVSTEWRDATQTDVVTHISQNNSCAAPPPLIPKGGTEFPHSSTPCCPLGFSPLVQPNGEDSLALAKEYIVYAIAQGRYQFDWLYEKYYGEGFPAEVTLTRIEWENRTVLQGVIYDTSDRKVTEMQLLKAKEAAEAGNRSKSEFLATMSHELRTPLNAILVLSQLMKQETHGRLNNKQKEYISHIQKSGEHLLALINDILDLSKVEVGKEQLTFVPLDIQELCEYCLAMVREQANEQGLELTLRIDEHLRFVIADERRCKQMLLNLLSNAVKFTLAGEVSLIVTKRVVSVGGRDRDCTVSAHVRSPAVATQGASCIQGICFMVQDTGIGIASDQLPLLFEPFRQLDSGLNRRFPGTGLGLALTRSLARLHGGDVTVKSTLGQGSQFTLCLPDRSPEELVLPLLPPEPTLTEGASCPIEAQPLILLVAPDERSTLLLKDYLQVIGYRVEHLTKGQEFIQAVRAFQPNLILLDVELGEEYTGFDLLSELRQEPDTKTVKVVMLSAIASESFSESTISRERCIEAGADDYLQPPISVAQLEAILMRYL